MKDLDVAQNKLCELPSTLSHLRAIQSLDLSDNKLDSIPEYLGILPDLVSLKYMNNPFKVLCSVVANHLSIGHLIDSETFIITEFQDSKRNYNERTRIRTFILEIESG